MPNQALKGEYGYSTRLLRLERSIASWRPALTIVTLAVLWFALGRAGTNREIFLAVSSLYLAALLFYHKIVYTRSEAKNILYWWQLSFILDLAMIGFLAYLTGELAPALLLSSLLYIRVAAAFRNWRAGISATAGVILATFWGLSFGLASGSLRNPVFWVSFYLLVLHAGVMLLLGRYMEKLAEIGEKLKAELSGLSGRLRRQAITDQVTGLYNHHHFMNRLQAEISRAKRQGTPVSLALIDIDGMQKINQQHGHQQGDRILRAVGELMRRNFRDFDILSRFNGDTFAVALYNTDVSRGVEVVERFRRQVEGARLASSIGTVTVSIGVASYPDQATSPDGLIKYASIALNQAKVYRNRSEGYVSLLDDLRSRLNQTEIGLISTVKTLISVINAKDPYTFGHCERVVELAIALSNKLMLPADDVKIVKFGAFLHDFGKIEISREILNKREPLTDEEWEQIRQHPRWGAEIIKSVRSLKPLVPVILHHHERYDGTGYPDRLQGSEIPLAARVLAVVDSFDAMTSDRPYRKARSIPWAVQELRRCTGKQFDPEVVEAFVEVLKEKYNEELLEQVS